MSAWNDAVVVRVAGLVEYRYRTGAEVDARLQTEDGGRLEVAECVGLACAALGVYLPLRDSLMGAVLARDAQPAPEGKGLRGVVLQLADGRLAMTAGRGEVIETIGGHLAYVTEPEPGRYINAWVIPGVEYWGVKRP